MNRRSPLVDLDPRMKIMAFSALALAASLTPVQDRARFAACLALLIITAVLSRLSPVRALKRMLLLVPLLAFLILSLILFGDGSAARKIAVGGGIVIKAILVYGSFLVLILTTETVEIIGTMERLKLPRLFTALLFFAVRYFKILSGDVIALRRAAESRSFGKRGRLKEIGLLSRVMFLLFMRALDRSQRIYAAMLSRGYKGKLGTAAASRLSRADFVFGMAFFGSLGLAMAIL